MKNIICKHCGRFLDMNKKERKGLCDKHYLQQLKYGYFLDDNQRTKGDPNNIIIYEDYAEIELYDVYGNIIEKTIIDIEDIQLVSKYKWSYHHKGYVTTKDKETRKEIRLHNLIMGVCDNKILVDHINHNDKKNRGLDNRKCNLRLVTRSQNGQNSMTSIRNTSGVKGVSWNKKNQKWKAYISVNKLKIELGWFENKNDAIKARKEAEIKYYGEYNYRGDV